MIDIACVGILVADVLTKTVDTFPKKGLLEQVDSIELFSGGNAMTASINIKKIGLESAIIGKIGNDSFGDSLANCLVKAGVETKGLSRDNNAQTSTSVLFSDKDGERTFFHCVGANGTFSYDDINWDVVNEAKIVFVTGTYLLNTFDGKQTVEFLKKCKEMGKITALDVCWDSKNRWGEILNDAMPYIDYFMPSIDEAKMIAKEEEPEKIADVFFERGVKKVIIKLGKIGCYIRESKDLEGIILPSYKSIKAVDTTGAGDSFCSGFLSALAKGKSFRECAEFANAVGAHCVMEKGATTGIKSYDEIIDFMKNNK